MKNIFSTFVILGLIFFVLAERAVAQELNAQVIVQTPKLKTADPKIFRTLEQDLKESLSRKLREETEQGQAVHSYYSNITSTRYYPESRIRKAADDYALAQQALEPSQFPARVLWQFPGQVAPRLLNVRSGTFVPTALQA